MPRLHKDKNKNFILWALLICVGTPLGAYAGISAQGISAQGISAQGISAQGISAQGISAQGISAQGISAQGISAQGISAQGISAQGQSLMGNDLLAPDIKGVAIKNVEIHGLTAGSGVVSHTLTRIPSMSTGDGNYISLGGASAEQHFAVAHLVDGDGMPAEDLDLFIAKADKDPVPNLFHNFNEQDNEDELYVVYFFSKWNGQWLSLCPYNPLTKSASAVAIAEDSSNPDQFFFACTATGVDSKCARNWGYRPWAPTTAFEYDSGLKVWRPKTYDLKDYYNQCKRAAMADYCQTGKSFTKTGTQVDLFDTQQIIWPNTIEAPWSVNDDPGSLWMNAQEYFIARETYTSGPFTGMQKSGLQRSRYREISPISECDDFGAIDRLDHDHIEDGRWGTLFKEVGTFAVFSPTYCKHDEYHKGDALPWDCSPCTTQVCKTNPECCGGGPGGLADTWTQACINQAVAVCNDDGTAATQWPAGRVWPKSAPTDDQSIYPSYLIGPAGAVLRADGVSGLGTSTTISGWACDPEWAGGSVAIRFFAGGTADGGGTQIGEVRADQALASPLLNEVSIACDGPGRTSARHGFSFTLPANQAGNVYVYAIDESTDNGPHAPPTLLRNGVVQVPRCAHSEHVAGGLLSASCSTCASTVCNDGTHDACCTTAWDADCVTAADACASGDSSAEVNSNSFVAVATGWIEATTDGTYTFESSLQPSRLFVNGATVIDWFTNPAGMKTGTIDLRAGHRYSLRWDRLQAELPSGSGPGLTWQPPGTIGQTAIPRASLYAVAASGATGVSALYFQFPAFGGATQARVDANIDINKDVNPPGAAPIELPAGYGPAYSAIYNGEIIPTFTESYNFSIAGAGDAHLYLNGVEVSFPGPPASVSPPQGSCSHDLCLTGAKLDATCSTCATSICANDPFCCDGGYVSYYSFLPEWDARCLAEVANYCPGFHCTPPPADPAISPEKKSVDVPMQAGVHYALRMTYDNGTSDKTIRLLWASPRTLKQPVPQFAFQPPGTPSNAGSGLNVVYFSTKDDGSGPKADKPVGSGYLADLSLTPTIGLLGMPVVDVLASPVDATIGQPSPPSVVRPRYGEEVFIAGGASVHVTGIGGITSGAVRIGGGLAGDVIATVDGNGHFAADVPLATGNQTLTLTQQTYATAPPCASPPAALCADSKTINWPITVTVKTATPKAPKILQPVAPVANPPGNTVIVTGTGSTGPVHVTDLGSEPTLGIPDIIPLDDGTFSASITLDSGSPADPKKGWHKLVFDQGGDKSAAVFVSVGVDPPLVVFPRNGAEIDCSQTDGHGTKQAIGILPYPETVFGKLRVMEETGRLGLRDIKGRETTVNPPQNPGDPITFITHFNPGPGRHVVYFFQADDPPDPSKADEWFRDYSRLAETQFSKIVIEDKPPRVDIAGGSSQQLRPQQPFSIGSVGKCNTPQQPGVPDPIQCAQARADVNVRVGKRVYTTRADDNGNWHINIFDLPLQGWNDVTVGQVLDSSVGGAWSESCPSNTLEVGYESLDNSFINVPPDISVFATGPAGAIVNYPDVTARTENNQPLSVECLPQSGATFPIGTTFVHCAAFNPASNQTTLSGFVVNVIDGPPTIFASDVVAEADQPHGIELETYPVIASDAVDGNNLFLECIPAAPSFFFLDQTASVFCDAIDSSFQSVSTQFTVRVQDTTPPTLCALPDIMSGTNSGSGAIVTFATCASDIVDGDVTPTCDHQSGSFFPLGTTVVTCRASDAHGNTATDTFTVSVGDTTPPVLKMPTVVTAFATSKAGARVNYTVTATDNVDPNPKVKCTPPSGSQFPLGRTTVKCSATDNSGNTSQGTFIVKVIVNWSGLLPPIPQDGTGVFDKGSTIPVKFSLTPPSDGICDLLARLYIAPIDAAGKVGAEKPATSHGVSSGNTFSPTGNHYQLNMETGAMTVGRWQLRVDLGDLEIHTTPITLR